jgi:Predicted permease
MWAGLRWLVSRRLEEEAREHAIAAETGHLHHSAGSGQPTWRQRLTSVDAWSDVAYNFRGDWQMLWKEIGAGFLIAGFVALLPMGFFNALFLTDAPGPIQTIENVLLGPIVALLTFVCSVGNVPLAAVLWGGGISFAGVIAFIYADVLITPLILIYLRYYGRRVTCGWWRSCSSPWQPPRSPSTPSSVPPTSSRALVPRSTPSPNARSAGTTRRSSTSSSSRLRQPSWRSLCDEAPATQSAA